jgi:hypothetical protein
MFRREGERRVRQEYLGYKHPREKETIGKGKKEK